jgi:hypothetical protein
MVVIGGHRQMQTGLHLIDVQGFLSPIRMITADPSASVYNPVTARVRRVLRHFAEPSTTNRPEDRNSSAPRSAVADPAGQPFRGAVGRNNRGI